MSKRTFDAFTEKYLTTLTLYPARKPPFEGLWIREEDSAFCNKRWNTSGLEDHPEFAMRVKNLTINFTYDHDGLPMKETIKTSTRPLANLRSLSIIGKGYPMCGEAYSNEAYQALPSDFQLPHLEHFTIRGVRELRMQDFVNLFTNHKSTLKSVVLIDITLIEINEGERRQWKDLLETAKVLRPSVTFHIGVPFAHIPHLEQGGPYKPWGEKVFVCFTPSEDEPDREAVRVVMEAGAMTRVCTILLSLVLFNSL